MSLLPLAAQTFFPSPSAQESVGVCNSLAADASKCGNPASTAIVTSSTDHHQIPESSWIILLSLGLLVVLAFIYILTRLACLTQRRKIPVQRDHLGRPREGTKPTGADTIQFVLPLQTAIPESRDASKPDFYYMDNYFDETDESRCSSTVAEANLSNVFGIKRELAASASFVYHYHASDGSLAEGAAVNNEFLQLRYATGGVESDHDAEDEMESKVEIVRKWTLQQRRTSAVTGSGRRRNLTDWTAEKHLPLQARLLPLHPPLRMKWRRLSSAFPASIASAAEGAVSVTASLSPAVAPTSVLSNATGEATISSTPTSTDAITSTANPATTTSIVSTEAVVESSNTSTAPVDNTSTMAGAPSDTPLPPASTSAMSPEPTRTLAVSETRTDAEISSINMSTLEITPTGVTPLIAPSAAGGLPSAPSATTSNSPASTVSSAAAFSSSLTTTTATTTKTASQSIQTTGIQTESKAPAFIPSITSLASSSFTSEQQQPSNAAPWVASIAVVSVFALLGVGLFFWRQRRAALALSSSRRNENLVNATRLVHGYNFSHQQQQPQRPKNHHIISPPQNQRRYQEHQRRESPSPPPVYVRTPVQRLASERAPLPVVALHSRSPLGQVRPFSSASVVSTESSVSMDPRFTVTQM
ncbi:hypothetical protein BJ741DRAFT_664325 [Chytriomyces cf. hyalinus JEL632]|nr:hypothetical protein BJ741DRAFT_664325 [Chytriomyces cf. hyalinus JEL632]